MVSTCDWLRPDKSERVPNVFRCDKIITFIFQKSGVRDKIGIGTVIVPCDKIAPYEVLPTCDKMAPYEVQS